MKLEEFYSKYANTPIANRQIKTDEANNSTLHWYFSKIEETNVRVSKEQEWLDFLLNKASEAFEKLEAAKDKTFR